MRMFCKSILFLMVCTFSSLSAETESSSVKASLRADHEVVVVNEPFWAALTLDISPGWTLYWKNPGESGLPTEVTWTVPDGVKLGQVVWPLPSKKQVDEFVVMAFSGENQILVPVTVDPSFSDKKFTIGAEIAFLVCSSEACVPGSETLSLDLSVGPQATLSHDAEMIKGWRQKAPKGPALIPAEKEAGLLWLSLKDFPQAHRAEFYPDESTGIDLKHQVTLEMEDGVQWLSLNALEEQTNSFKGLLALWDEAGKSQVWQVEVMPQAEVVADTVAATGDSFTWILFLAFIGGMILNLMPCVLPVISLKILHFVESAGSSRKWLIMQGLLFSFGVLLSFWALAATLLLLRASGSLVGWGFQLQEPGFVAFLAVLLLVFSLNFFGVFEIGLGLSAKAGDAVEGAKARGGLSGAFWSGVLATAVATPCSGPFLGTALGVAISLPPAYSMTVFTSLALGMISPYLLLCIFPSLLRFLPKPGMWMVTFREVMGFFMLLTVLWLVWVFSAQVGSREFAAFLLALFVVSFSVWGLGKFGEKKLGFWAFLALLAFGTIYAVKSGIDSKDAPQEMSMESGWKPFSMKLVDELRDEGKPVFIDFTAKWCLICQSNHFVLEQESVRTKMEELGVTRIMADWTRKDPEITKALEAYGRSSVPLYIYYPAGKDSKPVVLPQVLTAGSIIDVLEAPPELN
jgi:Thiol:disulfide interchange protein